MSEIKPRPKFGYASNLGGHCVQTAESKERIWNGAGAKLVLIWQWGNITECINLLTCAFKGLSPFASAHFQYAFKDLIPLASALSQCIARQLPGNCILSMGWGGGRLKLRPVPSRDFHPSPRHPSSTEDMHNTCLRGAGYPPPGH